MWNTIKDVWCCFWTIGGLVETSTVFVVAYSSLIRGNHCLAMIEGAVRPSLCETVFSSVTLQPSTNVNTLCSSFFRMLASRKQAEVGLPFLETWPIYFIDAWNSERYSSFSVIINK